MKISHDQMYLSTRWQIIRSLLLLKLYSCWSTKTRLLSEGTFTILQRLLQLLKWCGNFNTFYMVCLFCSQHTTCNGIRCRYLKGNCFTTSSEIHYPWYSAVSCQSGVISAGWLYWVSEGSLYATASDYKLILIMFIHSFICDCQWNK